jgi:hypothetical protein
VTDTICLRYAGVMKCWVGVAYFVRSCAHSALIRAGLCMFCHAKHTEKLHHVAPHDEVSTWYPACMPPVLAFSARYIGHATNTILQLLPLAMHCHCHEGVDAVLHACC